MRVLTTLSALFLSLALAFIISWQAISSVNFAYPVWYQVLEINKTIAKYGPQNQYRSGFESTTQTQHIQFFAEIAQSIELPLEQVKPALQAIEYSSKEASFNNPLLHDAEVQHLYDVAVLLEHIQMVCYVTLSISVLVFLLLLRRQAMPQTAVGFRVKDVYLIMLFLLLVGLVLVAIIGFETVFYQLHEWVFPAENQWFFYYQESLMTTLMQAPNLFAYIGGLLLSCMLIVQFLTVFVLQRILSRAAKKTGLLTPNKSKNLNPF
ncbi:DUF1461 domain-containing protein [Pseudoalteromonas phenolica]|uniref:lipoprotein intramolecular transacylase Lit n=1 Tax=Pseudoalteromonas phenolica TaxID=161398 RepID=UPI00110BA017|nr:DUF1461 domain-containing protein [Pseudoalteromonas phenolica]TMO57654.1 hypothetical protein CWC21_02125 [Pseudoalteromonas phenolica]